MQQQFSQAELSRPPDGEPDNASLPDPQWRHLLREWNQTEADFPRDACVHHLFEAQARRRPDAVAVTYEGRELTYAALNTHANQLAHRLRREGVGPDVPVGLCVERGLEMAVAVLGILKAGGAYVPLDPAYPRDRLAFMLEDSRAPVLITQECLRPLLEDYPGKLLALDREGESLAGESAANPTGGAEPPHLAYMIYTSGSTGRPKGAMVEHRGMVNFICHVHHAPGLSEHDVHMAVASLSFDMCAYELLCPLTAGAQVVIVPREVTMDGAALAERMARHGATAMIGTPATWRMLLDAGWQGDPRLKAFSAGEALPPALAQQLLPMCRSLWNGYGPTETSVMATLGQVESAEGPITIGRPIRNTQTYIVDPEMRLLPPGEPGELYIGGVGVGRGYLNRPELTAERFVACPEAWETGEGGQAGQPVSRPPSPVLYKSGDLCRFLPDGRIEYLGRIDHQVKIRGFRIELGEIETLLEQHPAVKQAVVLAREEIAGEKQLVAYVVGGKSEGAGAWQFGDLRAFLRQKLPDYMVPAAFVTLQQMPLTPNGKVDRRALPAPDGARPNLRTEFAAPRTPTEEALAAMWSQVLGIAPIGVNDAFLELGGHSLRATQVVSRVRDHFGLNLPLRAIFDTPTVAGLARAIDEGLREGGEQLPPILPAPRGGDLPLSFSQERICFLRRLFQGNLAYSFQSMLRFRGRLDLALLERCLSEIVRRHEVYRTSFPTRNGQIVQRIHEPMPISLPVADFSTRPAGEREAAAQEWIWGETQKGFDPERLPLVRWSILRLSPEEHLLLHVEDHLVHDGWSFNVFLRELVELYRAYSAGMPSPLPEPQVQFADFAAWQRQWLQGEALERQLAYWREKLAGTPPVVDLPADRPRPPLPSFRGSVRRIELPVSLCAALRELSRREGVSFFMTLLAGFKTLLYRYTGQEDVWVGSGIANRRAKETENLMGMLVNNVVLRTQLSGEMTFRELLAQVRDTTLEAYAHQDVPFDKVVDVLHPERDLSRNPLFQVMFNFHDATLPDLQLPDASTELIEVVSNGSAKFDLNIIIIPRAEQRAGASRADAGGATMVWEFSTDLFDAERVERMAGHFENLLRAVAAGPELRLAELPLLAEEEQRRLLLEWNATTTEYPRDAAIPRLFETQVERTPEAVALQTDGDCLSYRQLNERTNHLAHHLRGLGAGPGALVGIACDRSPDLVAGLLAILKAGAAYVPLDLGYPKERLAFMLEDARVSVLLTQRHLLPLLPEHAGQIVCLDTDWPQIAQAPAENLPDAPAAEAPAYVNYTSGSTGTPKGVVVPHRAVVRLVIGTDYAQLDASDVVGQIANVSFDAATFEIWGALLNGARLVILPKEKAISPTALAGEIERWGISALFLTTALFNQVASEAPAAFRPLRHLLFGGEACDPTAIRRVLLGGPPERLLHVYGPTENTTFSTWQRVTEVPEGASTVPIGRPVANTQAYILDPNRQPVPIGIPGELYLGGDGLALSYLNRPELTAERFVAWPGAWETGDQRPETREGGQEAGDRRPETGDGGQARQPVSRPPFPVRSRPPFPVLYRTGDLCRFLPDGSIEFLGRLDHQVKIRGFRIELGEIEATLCQHPAVREAAVLAREDTPGEKRLVAYVAGGESGELRAFLKQKLPDYMVPSAFMTLEALPLTPNGKVDRRVLPAPERGAREEPAESLAPRDDLERQLAAIWSEVLEIGAVGVTESFFDLGGHSLLATRILNRIHRELGRNLSLATIFEAPTVEKMAALLREEG